MSDLLSGVWEGRSVDHFGTVTVWNQTAVRVAFDRGLEEPGEVVGKGTSVWQGQVVDFDLLGTVRWEPAELKLTKQHRGLYTNSVSVSAPPAARRRAGHAATLQLHEGGIGASTRLWPQSHQTEIRTGTDARTHALGARSLPAHADRPTDGYAAPAPPSPSTTPNSASSVSAGPRETAARAACRRARRWARRARPRCRWTS